ncbi:hypothetical protein [Pseudomonas sp. C32]|uniref:hypothetical protein n=1 Tax=Pseudomonas sp. C32 TaxID=1529208 RepID=UPI002606ABD3|nr:hypothetical protein [Pseudomonas sp. C32]MDN4548036.1 hypothetical protein [Pseudomonas sp. C32]
MKPIRAITYGVLLTIGAAYSGTATFAGGTVILRDNDADQCNLPVPEPGQEKTYSFVNGEALPCGKDWNDKARTFQLGEVPSATTVLIATNRNCWNTSMPEDAPWFLLKTIKKLTSTNIIEIAYLASFSENQIIEPGLQMVEFKRSDVNRDKISCIRIKTSAAPPIPSTAP